MGTDAFAASLREEPEELQEQGFFTAHTYGVTPVIFDTANDRTQRFLDDFERVYRVRPEGRALKHYEAALVVAEALRQAGTEGTLASRDTDRQRVRDCIAAMTSPELSVPGPTGPLYFDKRQTLPQPARVGRFVKGRLTSAPKQFAAVQNPALINLQNEVKSAKVFESDGNYYWIQRVVYTGVDFNHVSRIDQSKHTFTADFYLWFRYMGDDDVLDIELNSAAERSPYNPKAPITEKDVDDLKYRAYRIIGEFKTRFDFHDYPFDQQLLDVRLSNSRLPRDAAIYAIDASGLRLAKRGNSASHLSAPSNWTFTRIQYYPDTLRTTSTRGDPAAFDTTNETEFSGFSSVINAKRQPLVFLLKTLLALILLVGVVYVTLHFPVSLTKERLTVSISAILASAVLLTNINQQLTEVGYTTAIEYGFYAFFGPMPALHHRRFGGGTTARRPAPRGRPLVRRVRARHLHHRRFRHHPGVCVQIWYVGRRKGVGKKRCPDTFSLLHPDKPPELWVNEVGVAPPHQNQGVGRRLLQVLFARGREVGCAKAWVGTEVGNAVARRLYQAVGGIEDEEPFVMVLFVLGG
jgi:branched-chain amino acid transport system substrate-binding protein